MRLRWRKLTVPLQAVVNCREFLIRDGKPCSCPSPSTGALFGLNLCRPYVCSTATVNPYVHQSHFVCKTLFPWSYLCPQFLRTFLLLFSVAPHLLGERYNEVISFIGYDHSYSTRHELLPVEQVPIPIKRAVGYPHIQYCHYCTRGYTLSGRSVACSVQCWVRLLVSYYPNSLHSTFHHYKS